MADNVKTCSNCGNQFTCTLIANIPALLSANNIPLSTPLTALPPPCGGDLWQQRVGARVLSKKAFANWNPKKPGREQKAVGGLDEILP